jgi:hypothetical protein
MHLEIGDVNRFPTAAHLASYAGLVPTVHASAQRQIGDRLAGELGPHIPAVSIVNICPVTTRSSTLVSYPCTSPVRIRSSLSSLS